MKSLNMVLIALLFLFFTLILSSFYTGYSHFPSFSKIPTTGDGSSEGVTLSFFVESNSSGGGGGSGGGGSGGGGGGSSSTSATTSDFSVSPEELNIDAVSGQRIDKTIIVRNTGKTPLTIDVQITGIKEIAGINTNQITVASGAERELVLSLAVPNSGIYAGRVVLKSGTITREVFVLLNIKSANSLFDVSLSIPQSLKVIAPGANLKSFISLLEVGPATQTDATVKYTIKDFDGTVLYTEEETFSVFRSKSYVKNFDTSKLPSGDYIAGIEVTYAGGFAASSAHFTIGKYFFSSTTFLVSVIVGLATFVLALSWVIYKKSGRYTRK